MPKGKQSRGKCTFCGLETTKGSINRHLKACHKRKEIINSSELKNGSTEVFYHLRVEDMWDKDYWLNLEMRGTALLGDLDKYLRAIWLECCGHLSRFSTGGWRSPDIPMTQSAQEIFTPGLVLIHQYDFGTTSTTLIRVVSSRTGHPISKHPIILMARNIPPEFECVECENKAECVCWDCLFDESTFNVFCRDHRKTHEQMHSSFELLTNLNSPRLGLCGYTGPATLLY